MNQSKIIFFVLVIAVVLTLVFIPWQNNSILGKALEPILPADWENISERNIVKNTVLLSLVKEENDKCVVQNERLAKMFSHEYFIRSAEVQEKLQYDEQSHTIVAPCEFIQDGKLRLHIRYVVEEAPRDGTKYEYWFTDPSITMTTPINSTYSQN